MNPKFKVGDKVQVVECIDDGFIDVGTILTVSEVKLFPETLVEHKQIVYFFEEDSCGCYEEELDYYKEG